MLVRACVPLHPACDPCSTACAACAGLPTAQGVPAEAGGFTLAVGEPVDLPEMDTFVDGASVAAHYAANARPEGSIIAVADRARKFAAGAPLLTNRTLFQRDRNLCLYCGVQFAHSSLTRDHVIPASRGGDSAGGINRLLLLHQ